MINIKEMTVLIADDMENMYNSIRSIMKLHGYGKKFLYASNGEEALKILRAGGVDLTILDKNMPVMTGLEVLKRIRQDEDLRDMPVIMITAHAEKEFITTAAESEIDAYILKPITVKLIEEKIPPVIEKANNPSPMSFHLKRARKYAEEGDLDTAIKEADLAIKANPKSSRPLREAGNYLLQKGNLEEAEKCLLKAAKMNPVDVVAFHSLGDLYLKKDNITNALKYFDKAVAISPRNIERGLNLGKILIQQGMSEKAISVFNKVFRLSHDPLELKEEIVDLCIAHGANKYAYKLLKDIINQMPNRADLLFKLGVICDELGNKDEAVTQFLNAERLDPANIHIKLQLAQIYIDQEMLLRAEKPLKDILKLDPQHIQAQKLLRECIE